MLRKIILSSIAGVIAVISLLVWPYLHIGAAPLLSVKFLPQESFIYHVNYSVAGRANARTFNSAANINSWQDISGRFDATTDVIEVKNDVMASQLAFSLYDVASDLTVDGKQQPTATSSDFLVTISNSGFDKLLFPQSATSATRAQIRSVLALWQIVLPKVPAWEWEADEDTPQGHFRARYTIKRADSKSIVIKKSIVGEHNGQTGKHLTVAKNGSFTLVIDRQAERVSAIDGEIVTTTRVGSKLHGEEKANFALDFVGTKLVNGASLRDLLAKIAEPNEFSFAATLSGHEEFELIKKEQLKRRLGSDTVESLSTVIAQHAADWSIHDMNPVYLKLVALLKLYPDQAINFVDELLDFSPHSVGFGTVATALSTAGTSYAQATLQQAIQKSSKDEPRAMGLLPHLSMTAEPTESTEEFLRDLSQSGGTIAATATLGLGTMAHHLKESARARSTALLDTLAQRLSQAQDVESVRLVLSAVGNIGISEQIPLLKPFVTSTDDELRAHAVAAFRHVDDPHAHQILMERGRNDLSPVVRARAVESLSFTPGNETTLDYYRDVLSTEREIPVLKEVLKNLSLLVSTMPESKDVLANFISHCGNSDLVTYATGLLRSATG